MAEHPVYQTKWLKFALKSLGLDDPFRIPAVFDSYSSLFRMEYRSEHVPGARFSSRTLALYPYLPVIFLRRPALAGASASRGSTA
jgi:hypothetical protein